MCRIRQVVFFPELPFLERVGQWEEPADTHLRFGSGQQAVRSWSRCYRGEKRKRIKELERQAQMVRKLQGGIEELIEELEMTKSTRNTGKPWTPTEVQRTKKMAEQNTPTRVIGLKLGRTPAAVSQKAHNEGISLKPTNQRPRA